MKVIAGNFPTLTVYSMVGGTMSGFPLGGVTQISADTVESVELVNAGKQYNYGRGGLNMMAGGFLAGPLGAVVGGAATRRDVVIEFVIRFRDGRVAHCQGVQREYQSALKHSYKRSIPRTPKEASVQKAGQTAPKATPEQKAAQVGGQTAAKAANKLTPEQKAERKARTKAVTDEKLGMRETYRRLREIDKDYGH